MIKELDRVALTEDRPKYGLQRDDIATVVLVHEVPGYELEFFTLDSNALAVISVFPHQVHPLG